MAKTNELNSITAGQKLVVDILQARLTKITLEIPQCSVQVWEEAFSFAVTQRVASIIYDYLKISYIDVPEQIRKKLQDYYRYNAIRNIINKFELSKICESLDASKIDVIPLKGVLLSEYLYNDAYARTSVDIDILVRPQMLEQSFRVLQDQGYGWGLNWHPLRMRIYRINTNHWPLFNPQKKISLELHNKFLSRSRSASINMLPFWQRAYDSNLNGIPIKIMQAEDHFLYLMLHSAKEFWESLLLLNDVATFIALNPALDWKTILKNAKTTNCVRRLFITLQLLKAVLNCTFPEIIESILRKAPDESIIINAVKKRIFHKELPDRSIQSTYIWLDYKVADRTRDRASILFFKFVNQFTRIITWRPDFAFLSIFLFTFCFHSVHY